MKQPSKPVKDERDQEIQVKSESYALAFLIAATQILTIMCLIKGNSAWKGSLALLFVGGAAQLFYKYKKYNDKPITICLDRKPGNQSGFLPSRA